MLSNCWDKQVYLFELDSVRKTNAEVTAGQRALLNEIIIHGNRVVITFNQLVESRGFFSLFADETYRNCLISLFEAGAIKVSQYGDIRTAVQYLISSIDNADNNLFLYSSLPVKASQKRLLALLRRALANSDLSEMSEYLGNMRSRDELDDLFVEVIGKNEIPSTLSEFGKRHTLSLLYWMVFAVLKISTVEGIYLPPRPVEEYKKYRLPDYLNAVIRFEDPDVPYWKEAKSILQHLECSRTDGRSGYLRALKKESDRKRGSVLPCQLAEAIVNLCYNYACEMSICNISKHYDVEELTETDGKLKTFRSDFLARLKDYWNNGTDADKKFLQEENNEFIVYKADSSLNRLMETAVNLCSAKETEENENNIRRYEYDLKKQRLNQWCFAAKAFVKKVGTLLLAMFILFFLAVSAEIIQNISHADYSFIDSISTAVIFVGETIIYMLAGELITTLLAKKIKWLLPLSDVVAGLFHTAGNIFRLIRHKYNAYVNPDKDKIEKREPQSKAELISYVDSMEMKRYRKIRNERTELFTENKMYPLADPDNTKTRMRITREKELFGTVYGVAYQSNYHMMIVDPIGKEESIIAYERVVPTLPKNGVVAVTVSKGKFILLRQFRHAPRTESLCFPRGFADSGAGMYENVKRELKEELKGDICLGPVFLGNIAADSGLSSGMADVVYVELGDFNPNKEHEGIIDALECSEDEMDHMIRESQITDGFTLGAYTLYKAKKDMLFS